MERESRKNEQTWGGTMCSRKLVRPQLLKSPDTQKEDRQHRKNLRRMQQVI